MNNTDALAITDMGVVQELQEYGAGFAYVQSMQVEFAGNPVLAGAEFAEYPVLNTVATIAEHITGLHIGRVIGIR